MAQLETKLHEIASRPGPAAPGVIPAFSEASPNLGIDVEAMTAKITKSVLGAVQPVLNQVQQDKADVKLAAAQQASFNQAALNHPDLGDPDTDMNKTFSELWNNRPDLHGVDGAPELLAEAARGLLATNKVAENARKMAAAAGTPNAPRSIDSAGAEGQEIDDALETLTTMGKTEGWNNDDMDNYLTLQYKKMGQANG